LLAEFRKTHPDVRIRLVIDNRDTVSRLLAGNEVDLAIMGRPPAELEATAIAFAPHPLVIVAAADHPLSQAHAVTVEELAGETLIVREAGSGTRSAMEQFFHDHSIKPSVGMEMSSNEAIKQAVVAGLGITFISQHTLGLELSSKRLHILKVEGTPVMRHWHLVRHKSKHLTPALAAFWEFVLEYAPNYLKKLG
jgi:DNA-binding transcriptional LysR family regulator